MKSCVIVSRSFWKYVFPWKRFFGIAGSVYAGLFTLIQIVEYFKMFPNLPALNSLKALLVFFCIGLLISLLIVKPFKHKHTFHIQGTDMWIQILFGDLFNQSGDLVIPFNTSLDTSLEEGIIRKNSTQGIFTNKYYGKSSLLDDDIRKALSSDFKKEDYPVKEKGNKFKCPIGTTIYLNQIPKTEQKAYLVALADMNVKAMAETNKENIEISLGELWNCVSKQSFGDELCMPVLGTGMARLNESRVEMCKVIIDSYLAATKQENKSLFKKLTIVFYPNDIVCNDIDFKSLFDFCDYKCRFYDFNYSHSGKGIGIA